MTTSLRCDYFAQSGCINSIIPNSATSHGKFCLFILHFVHGNVFSNAEVLPHTPGYTLP
jgi:hypothetical protein